MKESPAATGSNMDMDDVKSYPLPNELPCSSVVSFLHWVVCMMYWYTDRVHGKYECMYR